MAQKFALAEPATPVLGKRRVIGDAVVQIKAAEPAICEVQMHLFAEPPLRPDAEAIADQQHPDQQLWIDGGAARVTVEICKVGTDAAQVDEPVDGSEQVIPGNMIFKRELVEKRRLRFQPRSHHRHSSHLLAELNQQDGIRSSTRFSTE